MPISMERLVVFGDSLSDIGWKRNSGAGRFARAFHFMRTNTVYRYSDTRNWTDWIWEWCGGSTLITRDAPTSISLSAKHLKWAPACNHGSANGTLPYANYAEGGAMGASDISAIGLGTFADQVGRYKHDLAASAKTPPRGRGLYLVWFSLNDFVTNERKYSRAAPVAREIVELCKAVKQADPGAYFVIGNMPNPLTAVRFLRKAELTLTEGDLLRAAVNFNKALLEEVGDGSWGGDVVDLFTPMAQVSRNLASYNLIEDAQPHGIPVYYGAAPSAAYAAEARKIATSDEAHPTEEVYKVLARIWGAKILEKYDIGELRASGQGVWVPQGGR